MTLQDKIALVTGASRGIGQATVSLLRENGATVIGCSRGTDTDFCCDVSSSKDVHALFEHIKTHYGQLDILVNNAAMIKPGPITSQPLSEWDDHYQTNVRGLVHCCQHAFQLMAPNGGCIVNVSSLAGFQGAEKFPGFSAYVASKSAVTGLTEALAVEGKPLGIRVNAIAPGAVNTQMLHNIAPDLQTSTEPEDIAQLILALVHPLQSKSLNGTILPVYSNE
mgnify:FL=1